MNIYSLEMYTLYGNYTRTCIINIVMHVQTYLWRTSTNRDLRRVRAEGVSRSKTTDGSFVSSGDCWLNIRALALSYSSSRSSKLLNDFRPERSEEEPRIVSSYCIYNVHVIRVRHMLTSCICTQCKILLPNNKRGATYWHPSHATPSESRYSNSLHSL